MAPGFRQTIAKPVVNTTEAATVIAAGTIGLPVTAAVALGGQAAKVAKTEWGLSQKALEGAKKAVDGKDEGSWILKRILDTVAGANATLAVPGQTIAYGVEKLGFPAYQLYKKAIPRLSKVDQMLVDFSGFHGLGRNIFNGKGVYDDVLMWGRGVGYFTNEMRGGVRLNHGSSVLNLRFSELNGTDLEATFQNELADINDPVARDNKLAELAATWLNQQIGLAINDKGQFDAVMKAVKTKGTPEQARYDAILRGVIDRFMVIFDRPANPVILVRQPYNILDRNYAKPIQSFFDKSLTKYRKSNYDPTTRFDFGSIGLGAFTADARTWVDNAGAPIFAHGIQDVRNEFGLSPDGTTLIGPVLADSPVEIYKRRLYPRILDMFRHQPGFPAHNPALAIVEQELMHLMYAILMEQADPIQTLRNKYAATTDEAIQYANKSRKEQVQSMIDKGRAGAAALEKPWFVYLPAAARDAYKALVTRYGETKPETVNRPSEDLQRSLLGIPIEVKRYGATSTYDLAKEWAGIKNNLDVLAEGINTNMAGRPEQSQALALLSTIARPYLLALIDYIDNQKDVTSGMGNRVFTWLANANPLPADWMRLGANTPDPVLEREALAWFNGLAAPSPTDVAIMQILGVNTELILNRLDVQVPAIHRGFRRELAANIARIRFLTAGIDGGLAAIVGMPNTDPAYAPIVSNLKTWAPELERLLDLNAHVAELARLRTEFASIDRAAISNPRITARLSRLELGMSAIERDLEVYNRRVKAVEVIP